MNDCYSHVERNVFYIVENISGPEERSEAYKLLINDFNSQLAEHCNCTKTCSHSTCKCVQKSYGENYTSYWADKQLKYKLNNKTETHPIFECNENCLCPNDCNNRVVQRGPIEGLEIRRCDKGLGLFTSLFIPEGTFVCEYAGEVITKSQATMRHQTNMALGKMNYIFCLKEHASGSVVETFVDPSEFGNIGRYINHSCDPNCHIVPVRCDSPVPKLAVFTQIDIMRNEELTFHYGSSVLSDNQTIDKRIRCLCKSEKCTGYMPFHNY